VVVNEGRRARNCHHGRGTAILTPGAQQPRPAPAFTAQPVQM
jgi:hypothetical protein